MSIDWQRLYETVAGTPWTSWITHGLVALGLVAVTREPLAIALFWFIREAEQAFLELLYKRPVNVKDHVMDFLVPWAVIAVWLVA